MGLDVVLHILLFPAKLLRYLPIASYLITLEDSPLAVSSICMSVSVQHKEKYIRYNDILVVESSSEEPFALPGDSGSLVITERGEIVGLVFAGTRTGITYVAPLYPLLQSLDLTLLSYE